MVVEPETVDVLPPVLRGMLPVLSGMVADEVLDSTTGVQLGREKGFSAWTTQFLEHAASPEVLDVSQHGA